MKKNTLLLSILFVLIAFQSFSQTTTSFRKDYNISLFDIPMTSIEGLTPNTYVFAGFHAFNSSITAVDDVGVTTWSRRFSSGISLYIGDVKKDAALNRYYVCGGVDSGPAFLMFIDANGNLISGRNFSIAQASGASFNRVIKTSDGGYLCVGTVTRYDPDGAGPEVQFNSVTNNDASCDQSSTESIQSPLIVKFDASGNHLWHQVLRYYVTSAIPANRIYNDASFVDVVEVSDGYIAVGNYDVNNVFSTFNSDCEDTTPNDAMILKTTTAGAIVYHRQIDNPSNSTGQSSKSFSSASLTSAGLPLISGSDGSGRPMVLMRLAGSGGWSNPSWIRKYGASSFFGVYNPFQPGRFFETSDGNYAVWGFHINTFAFEWSNALLKIDPGTGVLWSRQYTNALAVILPHGEQASDDGFIGVSYTLAGTGHNLHLIKTDPDGISSVDCPATNVSVSNNTPTYTWGTPIFNSWNTNTVTNGAFTPTVANITPTETIQCLTTACTPPPLADNVTATPNPICAGDNSTINATGPGVNVSYTVYDAPTGGTNLGGVPLVVSPGTTTTYYVETVDNTDPTCVSVSRVPIEIIVNPAPTVNPASNSPLCVGETLNLTTTAVTGGTYSWTGPNGFNSTDQNPTIPGVTLAADGTYSLTVTANGCSTGPVTIDVVVSETPTATAGAINTTICEGEDIELTGNLVPGGTYSWTGPNGFTSTDQNPTIPNATSANAGTYSLEISIGSCTSTNTAEVTISVDPSPTATAGANATDICEGDDIELTGNLVPGGTYSWTGPNGFTSTDQNPTIPNATGVNAGVYSLVTTIGSCSSTNTAEVTITVSPTPTATAGAISTTVCEGEDVELTGNLVPGGTYSWTGPNGFTSTDQNPTIPNANATHAGTYSLEISIGSCTSTNTAEVTINVNPSPTATAGANATDICEGDDIELTANTIGGATYSWTGPNGFNSTDQNPTIPNATGANAGVYSLIITLGGCSSANTAEVTITVNPSPTANANATSTELCEGEDIELTAGAVGGGSYSWTGPNGFTSTDQNPTIPNATGSNTGVYSLVTTIGTCSSTNTAEVTITVNPLPNATASSNSIVCEGQDLILTATGGSTYSWTGPNGFTGNSDIETINNATTVDAGTYDVTVTDGNGCESTAQTTVTISEGPSLTISGNAISCFGANDGDAEVVATGDGPFDYSWSPSGGTNAIASGLSADTYTVTVTDDNGCSNSENITINEPTELTISTSSTASSCTVNDGTATVVASGGTTGYTYSWSSGGNSDIESNIGAGIYTIIVTDANGCTAQENVTVGSVNGPTLSLINSENISCFGANDGSAEVEAAGGTPGYTYSWTPSGGSNTTATGLGAGTYTATVTDDAGCTAAIQVEITEPDALVVSGTATDANCGLNDGTITASVTGGNGSYTYTWTPNVGNTAALSGLPGGSYSVTVEDANGCSVSTSFTVGVSGSIPIDVIPDITTIDAGDNVDLEVIIGGGITGANIVWSPTDGLSCTTCPNPNASPSETTTYYVTVTTSDGCSSTDSVIVIVDQPCGELFIPNIFSPNNDGNNDQLCIYGGCIESMEFAIYSRWGEKVFETTDPNECWDGTFKGQPLNSEIFVYKIIVKLVGEAEEVVESGNINLVR